MENEVLKKLFESHKDKQLYHRYITNKHIDPLLNQLKGIATITCIGKSVLLKPIYTITVGSGEKRILMWSQMHGNESTTTKSLFDLLHTLSEDSIATNHILKACTLCIIPILNPDGAEAYTRLNAKEVDLNRDAQALSQPESKQLRQVFEDFKPHYCYNLHGQRTIFSAGNSKNPATVSFLAPAQDEACTITANRKVVMEIIGVMNDKLQTLIPNCVGVYDDAFNLNCVGDTFQNFSVPTLLFEAGHFPGDYGREKTREYIYMSLLISLDYIAKNDVDGSHYESYFNIPENQKCFFDIIIRNADINHHIVDIGILYKETLQNNCIEFIPIIEKMETLSIFYGHKEINAKGSKVFDANNKPIKVGSANDFVMINNEFFSLLLK